MRKAIYLLFITSLNLFAFEWNDWSGDIRFRYQLENQKDIIITNNENGESNSEKSSLWRNRYRMRVRFGSSIDLSQRMNLFFKITTNDTTFSEFKYSSQIAAERFYLQFTFFGNNKIYLGIFDNPFVKSTLVMDSWYGVTGFAAVGEIMFNNFLLELKTGVLFPGSHSPEYQKSLYDGVEGDYPYLFVGRVDILSGYFSLGVSYFHYTTGEYSIINPSLSIFNKKISIPFGITIDSSFNFSKNSDNKGIQTILYVGKNSEAGDFMISGYYRYLQLNGTNPLFTDSDFHNNKTNGTGFYLNLSYSLDKNWLIQTKGWISEDINGDFKNRNLSIQTVISY
ncbi:putative porin [bacterium]|nr:putative porin [bacterium]